LSGKPFDATSKELIRNHPKDWLDFLGLPARSVTLTDADLSTVSAEADPPYVAHLELQAKYKPDDNERFLVYNVLVGRQKGLPVRTVVFLLRPEADGPGMKTALQRQLPGEEPYLQFRFRVVRVWEQPVEAILEGGVGLLPLAPLCNVTSAALPGVIQRMAARIEGEAPDEAGTLWTSTYVLMGLRYSREFAAQLLKGVRGMKESSTYQAILEEGEARGEAKGERNLLLRLGTRRFGAPDASTRIAIEAITSVERLEQLGDKLLEVESWAELLG
jgi:predicted transposase YdaD